MEVTLLSSCEEDTLEIGRALGEILVPGDVVALTGELGAGKTGFCKGGGGALGETLVRGDVVALRGERGAGKTVFCKGVGEALGISPARIVSPSFTIVTEHPGRVTLCHVDGYRLSSEGEG